MIPSIAHFVWYGRQLPYLHALAIRSAATHGGFESVRLHHADPLDDLPHVVRELPNFELMALDDIALCEEVAGWQLAQLCAALKSPAARANVVRTALVFRDGGMYLDTDTLTIRSFDTVRATAPAVIGLERIVFPRHVVDSRDPRVKAKAYLLTGLRDVYRRLPHGYRYFRRIEPYYHLAMNNAIIGGVPGHALWRACLEAMTSLPRRRWHRSYALGTHLFQATCAAYEGADFYAFPPPVFYPLPPEISEHWFRCYRSGVDPLEAIDPTTCCIHWYASVRTKKVVATMTSEQRIRKLASNQLYSALAARILDGDAIPS